MVLKKFYKIFLINSYSLKNFSEGVLCNKSLSMSKNAIMMVKKLYWLIESRRNDSDSRLVKMYFIKLKILDYKINNDYGDPLDSPKLFK